MTEQPFNADEITTDNWDGLVQVQPLTIHACQMNFPEGFSVTTEHGVEVGEPGDYLVIKSDGEKHPIAKDTFEKLYNLV